MIKLKSNLKKIKMKTYKTKKEKYIKEKIDRINVIVLMIYIVLMNYLQISAITK